MILAIVSSMVVIPKLTWDVVPPFMMNFGILVANPPKDDR